MFKTIVYAAVACLLLAQCIGINRRVMPEYKSMNVEESRLGILFLADNMTIKNPDDVVKFIGEGGAKDVFNDFFTSEFEEFAAYHGKFGEVVPVKECETSGFTKETRQLAPDDALTLRLPPTRACMGDSLPYLLLLDNFAVSREQFAGKTVVMVGYNGTMTPRTVGAYDNLIMTGTFLLWDNRAGKVVSFGRINQKTEVLTAMTKQTWVTAVESISSKVFIDTPYGIFSVPAIE